MGAFEGLLNQIDAFIRKFYKNQMLRGVLLFALVFLVTFLVFTVLEYFGRFNSLTRAVLFFGFITVNVVILGKFIILPLMKLFSFGKRISRNQASQIIGSFFPNINDRLLNTLQLNTDVEQNIGNVELLKASVSQRAKTLSVVPFTKAVDYKENKGYLKYLIPILLLVLGIAVFLPSVFKDGTERLVNYSSTYEIPAPFEFNLLNKNLLVEEGSSLELEVELIQKENKELPNKIYLKNGKGIFLMKKSTKNKASYTIPKIITSDKFSFKANGFESNEYALTVVGKTSIGLLEATLEYPAYLDMKSKKVDNAGDLVVPEGTKISWNVLVKNTDEVQVRVANKLTVYKENGFRVENTFLNDDDVLFALVNSTLDKVDTINYKIDVLKDAYPTISVQEELDTIQKKRRFFQGEASDDKGLRNVNFVYTIKKKDGRVVKDSKTVPGIRGTKSSINMVFDISTLPLELEDEVSYFFIAYDNDGVNGSKSSRSATFSYKVPSKEELEESRSNEGEKAKDELKNLLKRSEQFNKNINELKKDLFENKNTDWNQMQQLEQLKLEQQQLQKSVQQLKEDLNESLEEKAELSEVDEEILEKQEMIDKLMEELMDDEMMELLDKLEEMMKNQDQEDMQDLMEEMEMDAEKMNKNLDRTLEQLKKMQVNENIDDLQKTLEELAEKQLELSEQVKEDKLSDEEALKEQQKIDEEFKKAEEDLNEILKENEELDRPMDLDDLKNEREEVKEEQKDAKESLENKKSKKASDQQKKAGEKMQEMAAQLEAMQEQDKEEQAQEDMDTLRGILENLMELSFNQEFNMNSFKKTSVIDPGFVQLGRVQRKLMDDEIPVEDSLVALAKRVPKIASFIDKELKIINLNFKDLVDDIDERRKKQLGVKQQYVMTSFNNLALFLNETLQQMQEESQSQQKGEGECENPGGKGKPKPGAGKPQMGDMKEMLKKQLESLEKGMSPGGKKPGGKDGQPLPMPFGNKQAAQMAAQQSAMRQKLEQLKKDLNKEGKGKGNQLNDLLKELEDQERDLINKNWDRNLINRQKEIMTRLLESEKALEERGFDEKRESKSGKNVDFGNQIEFLEYNKQKAQQIELLRSLDPTLERYYKDKANDYFNKVN